MTGLEQYLIDSYTFLEKLGLKPFLIGSTLLQLARSGEFKYRHVLDKEINIGCLDEDLTQEIVDRIHVASKYFNCVSDHLRKNTLIFFAQNPTRNYTSEWEIEPGFTLLVPFFKSGTKRVEYMGEGHCLVWPAYHLDKYDKIKFQGHTLRTPHDYQKWLSHYFGDDWKEENLDWHWTQAKNLVAWGGGDKFG